MYTEVEMDVTLTYIPGHNIAAIQYGELDNNCGNIVEYTKKNNVKSETFFVFL